MHHRFLHLLAKGKTPQFFNPLFSSRLAIKSLFCMASQAKDLTLGGAQIFQTIELVGLAVTPKNYALYADLVVYCSLLVRLHDILSITSFLTIICWSCVHKVTNWRACSKEKPSPLPKLSPSCGIHCKQTLQCYNLIDIAFVMTNSIALVLLHDVGLYVHSLE
jgi:hypothetical protein